MTSKFSFDVQDFMDHCLDDDLVENAVVELLNHVSFYDQTELSHAVEALDMEYPELENRMWAEHRRAGRHRHLDAAEQSFSSYTNEELIEICRSLFCALQICHVRIARLNKISHIKTAIEKTFVNVLHRLKEAKLELSSLKQNSGSRKRIGRTLEQHKTPTSTSSSVSTPKTDTNNLAPRHNKKASVSDIVIAKQLGLKWKKKARQSKEYKFSSSVRNLHSTNKNSPASPNKIHSIRELSSDHNENYDLPNEWKGLAASDLIEKYDRIESMADQLSVTAKHKQKMEDKIHERIKNLQDMGIVPDNQNNI